MNLKQFYFTTGEFAKLCNVTKDTLFHYDAIGLFSPELTLENGYRYYSALQYDVFNVIVSLRELGMPLRDVKAYLDRRSPEKLLSLLAEQQKTIEQKISRLKRYQSVLHEISTSTQKALNADPAAVTVEEEPEETLLLSDSITQFHDKAITMNIAALIMKRFVKCFFELLTQSW